MSEEFDIPLPGLTDSDVPFRFRRIPAGSFWMGQRGGAPDEEPVHRVEIPEPFLIGVWPVTQKQYRLMAEQCAEELAAIEGNRGASPSQLPEHGKGDRYPVESVSWDDASCICDWLTRSGLLPDGWGASLPSESHWEYACRAGMETKYSFGNREQDLTNYGWFADNADGTTHPVGEKRPNAWGLFDMHGNVQEWCLDLYDPRAYRKRVDRELASALITSEFVEHETVPDWLKALVPMLERFANPVDDGDLQIRDSEQQAIGALQGMAEIYVQGNKRWLPVIDAVKQARRNGWWARQYCTIACDVSQIYGAWLHGYEQYRNRVIRGGSWFDSAWNCRAAYRNWFRPDDRSRSLGFRVCLFFGPVVPDSRLRSEQPEAGQGVKPPPGRRQ